MRPAKKGAHVVPGPPVPISPETIGRSDHSFRADFPAGFLESPDFHRILDLVPALIWVAAPDAKSIYLNRPWLSFTGRTLEQELGDGWADCVHPDDVRSCMDTYLDAVRRRRTFHIEYRLRRHDGVFRWLLDTGVPLHDSDDRFLGYIGSCVDITEHKYADRALRETEERYRSVVAAMAEGIVLTDAIGMIYFCNASAERILGLSAKGIIGRAVKDSRWGAIHEDGSVFSPEAFPVVVTLATGQPCFNVVMGLPRAGGDVAWLSINTQPLIGEAGQSRGVVATFVDITERKRAEIALRRAHENLEQRVKDRTADLENANQRLRVEIEQRRIAEQELNESEERLRVVLSRAPDAIFLHDGERFLFANDQAAALYGFERSSDLVGRPIWDFIPLARHPIVRERIAKLMVDGGVLPSYETVMIRADGTELPIEISAAVCPFHGRSIVQAIARDITSRKEAENALRRSAEQISDLYNHAPCGYHSLDADGLVIRMNDTELNWLGYRREEVVGVKRFVELMVPISRHIFSASFSRLIDAGFVRNIEFELLRKDGSPLPVVLNATAVRDNDGAFVMTRSTVFDMTELKRAGQALRESEDRFRQLAEATSEGIAIHEGGTILDANEILARMFGYDRRELIGKIKSELVVPASLTGEAAALGNKSHGAGDKPYETLGVRRDGSTFPIEVRGKEVPYQGLIAHVTAVRDLTERKLTEERARQHQEQLAHVLRLSTMGEMAAGLAHEINQPLTSIANYAKGCLRRIQSGADAPAGFKEILNQVALEAQHASEVIRRLRNFIRKQESQPSKANINDVVREAVAFLAPEALQSGLTIDLELADGLQRIEIDVIQIEQVLLNLLRNACQALHEPHTAPRRIVVSTHLGERGTIEVAVCDTGPGVSPAVADRLFQPFFTTKSDGMGLGLSISKSIIESHGGRLWATANADRGMTFRFSLPAIGPNPRPAAR
ncbi:MAG TPA: PAS domain S-box protein [Phycisphaerae bacterium]|nr:PAS domain S-box protein [Phycisphaerae bacterium]